MTVSYADYSYYTDDFLGTVITSESEFTRYEREAALEVDALTYGRIADLDTIPDKVKNCSCAVADLLYKADTQAQSYLSEGLAGPVESWSNDGQSGKVDLGQSVLTESGKKKEIRRLCRLYLGSLGLMYAGVIHYES